MDRCTNSESRWIGIILFVFLILEVVGCHRVRLCHESVKCLEDERIRLDRFLNGSHLPELDQLQMECNRKVMCVWEELGCDRKEHTGMILEYSCIEDLPVYNGYYDLKSGTLLSVNYPNSENDEFRARLRFRNNVTLKLKFHDIGIIEKMLYLTVYTYQGKNWTKYSRLVGLNSQKSFPNANIFDISLRAKRVWITFTIEDGQKPPVTIRQCPNSDKDASNCPPKQKPPTKPLPGSQKWVLYTVIISALSVIILVIIIAFIWKRFSSIKCYMERRQKCSEQRPDILTHFPSDGNIITGDILAHEIEAAAAEAEAEAEADGNRNNIIEEDTTLYETIAVPHYTDFPQRPRPSLPDLPPLPGLASYIEVLPRVPEMKRNH